MGKKNEVAPLASSTGLKKKGYSLSSIEEVTEEKLCRKIFCR